MARIGVVTDSTGDLPDNTSDRDAITMVPLLVNWDGQTYRDKIDLSTTDFYRRLRGAKTMPKTGAPSPGAFEEAYRTALQSNDHVISVHVAQRLSGTHDVAKSVAASVDAARIHVVDSGSVSIGLGWLAAKASEMGKAGAEPPEILAALQEMRGRVRIFALLETLEFLQRGGRIGRAQALVGGLLNVKPIIAIRDGEVTPVERVRSYGAAVRRMVEIIKSQGRLERVGVMHADAAANADQFAREITEQLPGVPIDRGELTPVVGTHSGPGCVGLGLLLAR